MIDYRFSEDKLYLLHKHFCESLESLYISGNQFMNNEMNFIFLLRFSVLHKPVISCLGIECFLGWVDWLKPSP